MAAKLLNNYAFIDSQNVNLGVQRLGWKLDFKKFRIYLKDKYDIAKAYMFIGYLPENQNLYKSLQEAGYILVFKPILTNSDGTVKGNVDADLVLRAMLDYNKYEKAVIVTSDGDFYSLVDHLYVENKLKIVLSPNKERCSILLKKTAKEKIEYLDKLKNKISHTK